VRSALACVHRCFTLTGHLKSVKSEYLWSRANCLVRTFLKQPNRQLQQLLAVENETILQQLKPSTLYMMFQLPLTLSFLCTSRCHAFRNALHEPAVWNLPRTNVCEAASKKRLEHLLADEKIFMLKQNSQISTWYVLTQ